MRKLLFFIIFVISGVNVALSGVLEDAVNQNLRLRQLPGTEYLVQKFFESVEPKDTVYAVFNPTGNCPRCEGAINPVLANIKRLAPKAVTVLVSLGKDSLSIADYNKKFELVADHAIFAADSKVYEFINCSFGALHIPYLVKIDIASGKIISAIMADDNSDELISAILDVTVPIESEIFDVAAMAKPLYTRVAETLPMFSYLPLIVPDSIHLSDIRYQPDFVDEHLAFNDDLRGAVLLFRVNAERGDLEFEEEVQPTSKERDIFISAPDSLLEGMRMNHEIKYMPLSPRFVAKDVLAVSYSLPWIWQEGEYAVGYANMPCVLFAELNGERKHRIRYFPRDGELYNMHFNLYGIGDDVVIPCKRMTWPLSFDREEYEDIEELNPFKAEFYSHPQPILRVFKDTGNYPLDECGTIGNLPMIARETRTGSYFVSPVLDSYCGETVYTDGISGLVTVIPQDSGEEQSFRLFGFDDNLPLPIPDESKFYSYECVSDYLPHICRSVQDLRIEPDNIHAVIRYGLHNELDGKYSYVKVNRHTGESTELSMPGVDSNGTILACGLWRDRNRVRPYMIVKTDTGASIWTD